MPTPDLTTVYIRSVPAPLRRRVKAQAAAMGMTLAEWMERAATFGEALEWVDFHTSDPNTRKRVRIVLGIETAPEGKE